jgi:hypothetical protein
VWSSSGILNVLARVASMQSLTTGMSLIALLNPKTFIFLQKCPSYSGNLNSEMPGDIKNAFLHWGDV